MRVATWPSLSSGPTLCEMLAPSSSLVGVFGRVESRKWRRETSRGQLAIGALAPPW